MARGLYLHIPFCVKKCAYCSFYSMAATEEMKERYVRALSASIRQFQPGREFEIDTVFFGGGTPTLLGPSGLASLLEATNDRFRLEKNAEITLEANPGTVDASSLSSLHAAGFNRLSLGVQSLQDRELAALGRIHSAKEAINTVEAAHRAGFDHLSCDLMVGIPHQTEESLKDSVKKMASLPIDHLSAYLLSIEPGTEFFAKQDSLSLPDEETMADSYLLLCEMAEKLGFFQYETSNFAKKDGRCRHNLKYWNCEEYLAFGPAAHGFLDGRRYAFSDSLPDYLTQAESGTLTPEDLGAGGDFDEVLFLGMRLKEGVDLSRLERRFDRLLTRLRLRAKPLIDAGFLTLEKDVLAFTPKGYTLSNQILAELLF